MIDHGLSASTINVRLSEIRKLVSEARDNNLLDAIEAVRILTVPGVPRGEYGSETGSLPRRPKACWPCFLRRRADECASGFVVSADSDTRR
jgi:hypothetical protein